MPTPRRLLLALLAAVACLAGPGVGAAAGAASAPAAPCTCRVTTPDQVKAASAVFTGRVTAITPPANPRRAVSRTSTVQVERVYKPREGVITTPTVDVVTPRSFGSCAPALREGGRYVFFVESDEGFTATDCGGTDRATDGLVAEVTGLLGEGRPAVPVEPQPVEVTFTPVNTDDPPSFTRLAAPGLALVIVGLLGLAVVRRLGRARF